MAGFARLVYLAYGVQLDAIIFTLSTFSFGAVEALFGPAGGVALAPALASIVPVISTL